HSTAAPEVLAGAHGRGEPSAPFMYREKLGTPAQPQHNARSVIVEGTISAATTATSNSNWTYCAAAAFAPPADNTQVPGIRPNVETRANTQKGIGLTPNR